MSLYSKVIRPVLFRFDSERVHEIGSKALEMGLASSSVRRMAGSKNRVEGFGRLERFGLQFENPVGVAAGFDKNGILHRQLAALGFGFVEIGTVTLKAQPGNEKPRLFRLPKDRAVINRLGFNNAGAEAMRETLTSSPKECVLGINIGKNKQVPNDESIANYIGVFSRVRSFADYITVNVSSPNTPGLRDLQKVEPLDALLKEIVSENKKDGREVPILLKIAPDLSAGEIEAICDVCLRRELAGIIATNTTSGRDGLVTENPDMFGSGGLSGKPLKTLSDTVVGQVYRQLKGAIPIIGVGGIFSGQDAFDKILAGASLVQIYTGFIYGGPRIASQINRDLLRLLEREGFEHLDEAVGKAFSGT